MLLLRSRIIFLQIYLILTWDQSISVTSSRNNSYSNENSNKVTLNIQYLQVRIYVVNAVSSEAEVRERSIMMFV